MTTVARRRRRQTPSDLDREVLIVPQRAPRERRGIHPITTLLGESRSVSWIFITVLLLLTLLLVRPLLMSTLSYHRTASLLAERRAEVASLGERHAELERTRAYYRTDAFIAERAREYGFIRPGETGFVIRELAHPELVGTYARTQLTNATGRSADGVSGPSAEAITQARTPRP